MANTGQVKQVIGPVVDESFSGKDSKLPEIFNALSVTKSSGDQVILEVQQHLGEDSVRAIAMDATDGLTRGEDVIDTGKPIAIASRNICPQLSALVIEIKISDCS